MVLLPKRDHTQSESELRRILIQVFIYFLTLIFNYYEKHDTITQLCILMQELCFVIFNAGTMFCDYFTLELLSIGFKSLSRSVWFNTNQTTATDHDLAKYALTPGVIQQQYGPYGPIWIVFEVPFGEKLPQLSLDQISWIPFIPRCPLTPI